MPHSKTTQNTPLSLELGIQTPQRWVDTVLTDFDSFLIDHAACERKASGMALSMCTHYPDRPSLVRAMSDLAIEELVHYRDVLKWMEQRGLQQQPDEKDPYIVGLQQGRSQGKSAYLRDRLLLAAIIEKRGHERFALIAEALPHGPLQGFYQRIALSEARHYELFLSLVLEHCCSSQAFSHHDLQVRLNELLQLEAELIGRLPVRSKLH